MAVLLSEIRLIASQSPAGFTTHRVLVGPSRDSLAVVHTFTTESADRDEFVWAPQPPQQVTIIRVETIDSPSWVSWREIIATEAG